MIRRRLCPGAPAAFTALNSDILTLLHGHATCHHYLAGEKRGVHRGMDHRDPGEGSARDGRDTGARASRGGRMTAAGVSTRHHPSDAGPIDSGTCAPSVHANALKLLQPAWISGRAAKPGQKRAPRVARYKRIERENLWLTGVFCFHAEIGRAHV